MIRLAETVHLSWVKINIVSKTDWNELSPEPRHLGVPSGASKMISGPMYLSCTDANYIFKWTKIRFHDPHHLGVPLGASKMTFQPMYLRCKPCTYLASRLALSPNGPKCASTRCTIGCIQNDFWALKCSAQTVHLTCTDANSISNRTKTPFHMTHVTKKFH
jgi:hypothetical protein